MAGGASNPLDECLSGAIARGAVRVPGRALGPADFGPAVDRFARAGIAPREGVGICFENGLECIAAYVALARLGAVAVPLPPGVPSRERELLWRDAGCRWAVTGEEISSLGETEVPSWPDDVHWVMHSSGSTGVPKAIPLTLGAMVRNAKDTLDTLGMGVDLLHAGSMSQCYTNGLFNSFLLPVLTGGRLVVGPVVTALRVDAFLDIVRRERPEILWVNPTVVSFLARRARRADMESVRALISCTAPLSREEAVAAESSLGRPVLQSYGLTETLIVTLEKPGRDPRREFSAGVVVGGPDKAVPQPDGTLLVRNGAVTPGYVRRDGPRIEFFLPGGIPGESYKTGDLARVDEKGRVTITGRVGGVINVGGLKIGAERLEEILLQCPGVRAALVLPGLDGNGRESPVAFVEAGGPVDPEALGDRCAEVLGPAARPCEVRVVDSIPRTGNGKIDRAAGARLLKNEPAAEK